MEVAGKKVLVFGLGKSGIGAGALLEKRGAAVILYDGNPNLDTEAVRRKVGEGSSARIIAGAFPEELLDELLKTRRLPIARLSEGSGTERKTLERHRKYMVALLLIYTNGYEIIRGHLTQVMKGVAV